MTLRRRLLVAVTAVAALLVVLGGGVVLAQRAYLLAQLDGELTSLVATPRALSLVARQVAVGDVAAGGLTEVWVGRRGPGGGLVTVLTPATDPELRPAIGAGQSFPRPTTVRTESGNAARVRIVSAELPNGRATVYLARSTAGVERAVRRLAFTLGLAGLAVGVVLALIVGWVDRLGLQPIARMTEVADAIRRGDRGRRVPLAHNGSEAARLAEAMNSMIDATTASEARMARFVADVSHELRTPLTTVQGYAALAATVGEEPERVSDALPERVSDALPDRVSDALPERVSDAVRRIGAEATRMRRLVDGLLDLTGLDEHGLTTRAEVDLAPLLADVAADLRVVAPDREVRVEAAARVVVQGDRDRLVQALVALTSNAVRHTASGVPITITARPDGAGWVRVDVADAGTGIPAEHLPHLFDRFYRVDRSRGSGSGGSGLGLAIVASIARAHGGDVAVASAPGGTVFTIRLPAA